MTEKQKIGLSDRYILFIVLTFSLLITATAFLYYRFTSTNLEDMEGVISQMTTQVQGERVRIVMDRVTEPERAAADLLKEALTREATQAGGILNIIIFSHTSDDSFFRVVDTIQLSKNFRSLPAKDSIVQEQGGDLSGQDTARSLRKGLTSPVMDPMIFEESGVRWQNVYFPLTLGSTPCVVQFMLAGDIATAAKDRFRENLKSTVIKLSVLSLVLVLIVIAGSLVFSHNYSLLIRNLSRSLLEAGGGNLGINLRPVLDGELAELARSFNTMIEGLRERDHREKELEEKLSKVKESPKEKKAAQQHEEKAGEDESLDIIFRTGVQALKDNDLDRAIWLFRTLSILKPNGFGSHFNLGVAYAKKADYESSIAMFKRAKEINPGYEMTDQYLNKVLALNKRDG